PAAPAGQASSFENDVSRPRSWYETKFDLLRLRPDVFGIAHPLEFFEHLAPALCLLGFLAGDVAPDEVFGLFNESLLPLQKLALAHEIGFAGQRIVRVAQRIDAKRRLAELHRRRRHGIEEGAIVRHDENRAAVRKKVLLEPRDA